ncbi:hypothetical protein [Mycolicibacterium litorale]|uniref:Uncharacterized protein n=1 Tax=Mycolicibacterium litorale TaxID=758802 RepID=A0AAD1IKU1_9MYCO|nr:hypothetical protein [Mycolicibacterium litorale]MCV7415567.1 hypothetical protein [Mycolicibacterium litorale]TDY08821.1 hypothetical protein BCL50_0892 [Mycolicibacterium litorale]BBY16746.1 hypothetical protein MLIT_23380 [Mycolicibacterium litorale]
MQSSEHFDLPSEWKGNRRGAQYRLATIVLLALAGLSLLLGFLFSAAGTPAALKYCLLFALILTLTVGLGAAARIDRANLPSNIKTVELHGVSKTQISYSFAQYCLLIGLMSSCSAFCVIAATEIFVRQRGGSFPGASLVIGALGVFFASFVMSAALGRIRRGELILSNQGVEQRGWSFESRLEWSGIAGIVPAFNGHPVVLLIGYANAGWHRRYTTRIWRIDRLPPVPMIEVDCRKFDVDCRELYGYLRHYVDTPAAREELGTEAAIERARRANPAR